MINQKTAIQTPEPSTFAKPGVIGCYSLVEGLSSQVCTVPRAMAVSPMCPVIRLLSVYTNTENLFSVGAVMDLPYSFSLLLQKPSHPHYNTYKINLLCRV